MKKSKVVLAVVLAVVLLITILNVPTFSWFTRPQPQTLHPAQSGEILQLNSKNAYTAYNGYNVSIVTKSSATGVAVPDSYNTTCSDSTSLSGSGIGSTQRKYFCTTITNSSGSDQNVSLYVRTLSIPTSSNGTLALGVNGPTRSYRDYTALATPSKKTTSSSMRIYFQKPKNNTPDGWSGTDFYICWKIDPDHLGTNTIGSTGENGTYYKMTYCNESDGYYNYYADIPKTATHAFFAVENWGENKNVSEYNANNWKKRTQTLCNLATDGQSQTQSVVFQLTSTVSGGNTTVHTPGYVVTGNCINTYYEHIFVAAGSGNSFDARLNSSEYIGGGLEYYSSNDSVFRVYNDNNNGHTKGYIYPQGAGTATLYTKSVGGSYSDEQQVETTVHVTGDANYVFNDVPIVKNIKIPGSTADDANVVKVYWYIINNSKTTNLRYTIDSVYVGV